PLLEEFPQDQALHDQWRSAEAGKATLWLRTQVTNSLNTLDFDRTMSLLSDARETPGPSAAIEALQGEVERVKQPTRLEKQAREARLTERRAEAQQFAGQKQFESAIRILTALQKEYPDRPVVTQELAAAEAAKGVHERQQAVQQSREKAERLVAAQKFD